MTTRCCACGGDEHTCGFAAFGDQIARTITSARTLLGSQLNFGQPQGGLHLLKERIKVAMANVPMHLAEEALQGCEILPRPSTVTIASSGNGYAIIIVVGSDYATHAVVIEE